MDTTFLLLEDAIISAGFLGLSTIGLIISLKLLDFPDLSIDGTFALGGAIAVLSIRNGLPSSLSPFLAMIAGSVSGICVASLHSYFGIGKLMSGILMLGILYSANLLLLGGANASLLQYQTIFELFEKMPIKFFEAINPWIKIAITISFVAGSLGILMWLIRTRFGLIIRGCGSNREALISCGKDPRHFQLAGMAIAGMFPALSGCLTAQNRGQADVNMGIGLILTALASFLIGKALIKGTLWLGSSFFKYSNSLRHFDVYFSHIPALNMLFISALIGSFIYQMILIIAIRCGVWVGGVKSLTALIVIFLLIKFKDKVIEDKAGLL